MVKKSNKNKSPLEEKLETTEGEDRNVAEEPYQLSGNFKDDFHALCQEGKYSYIPRVRPRPHLPNSHLNLNQVTTTEERIKSAKSARKDLKSANSYRPDSVARLPQEDNSPKSFLINGSSDYFFPSIQVESVDREELDRITEVFIKNWLVDAKMMEILGRCFSLQENLCVLGLWRVGLNLQTLEQLSCSVCSSNIKTLILDNNPLESEEWHLLLRGSSPIQHLSLRHNLITADGCKKLAHVLSVFCDQSTSKLMSLNLSGNKVKDEGAEHLANGLKFNRSLLFLDLSNNCIGNYGTKKLAQAISKFPMTHEEVVMRRRFIWNKLNQPAEKKDEIVRDEKQISRPSKTDDSKTAKDGEKTKKLKKKDMAESGRKNKVSDYSKNEKSADKAGEVSSLPPPPTDDDFEGVEYLNLVEYEEGILHMKGNLKLISLNLSNNPIDEKGLTYLLDALILQDIREDIKESKEQDITGLKRLQCQGNMACPDAHVIKRIERIMNDRNPFDVDDNNLES